MQLFYKSRIMLRRAGKPVQDDVDDTQRESCSWNAIQLSRQLIVIQPRNRALNRCNVL